MENYFALHMDRRQVDAVSSLGLAHMGDGVFELLVRAWLCSHGRTKAGNLHRETVAYVSAPAQSRFVERLEPLLTPEEEAIYHRGRNAHVHGVPKNATPGSTPGPRGWSACSGTCTWRGRLRELTSCLSQ